MFAVLPDIVGGGPSSLLTSWKWLPKLPIGMTYLLAVQDGMRPLDVEKYLPRFGLFLGGSTEWKLSTLPTWGRLCKETGAYFHVGRVNSKKRIDSCLPWADSVDGSSGVRFSKTIAPLSGCARQEVFQWADH